MYCKYVKLSNGEDIIGNIKDQCETFNDKEFLGIENPVLISAVRIPSRGMIVETYLMQPWIKMGKTEIVQIPTRSIVAVVDLQQSAIDQYNEYISDYNSKENNKEDLLESESFDMDPDESIEEFLFRMQEEAEEETEHEQPRTRSNKTLH